MLGCQKAGWPAGQISARIPFFDFFFFIPLKVFFFIVNYSTLACGLVVSQHAIDNKPILLIKDVKTTETTNRTKKKSTKNRKSKLDHFRRRLLMTFASNNNIICFSKTYKAEIKKKKKIIKKWFKIHPLFGASVAWIFKFFLLLLDCKVTLNFKNQ